MRAAIFLHLEGDSSGLLGKALEQAGVVCDDIHLYKGEPAPDPGAHDILVTMGAAQQVWETEEHPWLIEEKAAIRHWVEDLEKPYFGICFGHQLLADALGGQVGMSKCNEIGILQVNRHEEAAHDPVFSAMEPDGHWMQWHLAEVTKAPDGAQVLASSGDCAIQAMSLGPHVVSIQFHAESSLPTIEKWKDDQITLDAMARCAHPGHYAKVLDDARRLMPATEMNAMRLFNRWIEVNALGAKRLSA